MDNLGLSNEEENNLKTISEYIFFDQFNDYASYNRFEQCFQPLFNNIPISLDKVFRNLVGEKKKYINYQRLVNSYLLYKSNDPKIVPDLKTFFEILFKSILKKENSFIGKPQEKTFNFITPKSCKKRECITTIKLLTDKDGIIHGLILQYDGIAEVKMYPNKIENNLLISLEMNLGILDEKQIKKSNVKSKDGFKEEFYRDAVTHVFGTISSKTSMVNFLGFKCISGKTVFVGYPEGDGFLFGNFGKKFHELKAQMSLDGINLLQPKFNPNKRTNFYLNSEANNLSKEDLKKDILIQDEIQLSQLNDEIQIDKLITTPIIDENHFLQERLIDEISGNDYKEVVNQNPRKWILKDESKEKKTETKPILTVDDALKEVEKEIAKSKEFLEEEKKEESKEKLPNINLNTDGELIAKGRRNKNVKSQQKKKKEKRKKKRAKNGKLHEAKALITNKKKEEIWNGEAEKIKNLSPMSFLKNKENYKKLKDKLSQGILNEISKLEGNFDANAAQNIITSIKGKEDKSENNLLRNMEKETKPRGKLISKNMKGEVKKVYEIGQRKTKSIQKPITSNIVIAGDKDEKKKNNLLCSDAQQILNKVEEMTTYSIDSKKSEYSSFENMIKLKASKPKNPKEKWMLLGNKIKRLSGPLLFQIIGCILKAIKVISDEIDGKITISLEERTKLLNFLEENEQIADFITQEREDNMKETTHTKKEKHLEEEDLLIPSDNPEKITSLPELETKMAQINKLLDNKNLKSEDKKKLQKLKNLYLQQKNILIENKVDEAKKEITEKYRVDFEKYINEEKKKREKAQEEAEKKLEEEIKKEKEKEKEKGKAIKEISVSEMKEMPEEAKTFRNQKIYKGSQPFTDPLFKPEKTSLCPLDKLGKFHLPKDADESDIEGWELYKWCGVEEIYEDYSVFYEGISVEDIIQGGISDCYFLSVLGSLCKFPELLENLFYFKEKTKEHIYGIYLYINGHKKLVLLDDFVPCIGSKFKQFVMSKSVENEIWVALIEKAWAKINGNYIRIGSGGTANEVFDILTEAYSEEIEIIPSIKEQLWNKLLDGEKKGFVMTAGTYSIEQKKDFSDIGLENAHAYTVLGVHEIKGEKVIRLRNPFGEKEFNGDWSDNSTKWTEELRKQYNYYEKDDGDFFMGYNDFMIYFTSIGIVKLHHKWTSNKLKIRKSEATKCQLIKVTIPQDDTLVYFQLYGKNPRIPNKKGEYPKVALSNLILVDKDFNYIEAIAGNKRHICIEKTLKKGDYYLFCDVNYRYKKDKKNHGYTITTYCGVSIPLENVTDKKPVPELLRKVFINYCLKYEEPNPQKNGVNVYITKSFSENIPYKVIVFENKRNNNYDIKVGLEFKEKKECCFYCDDIATESDLQVIKNLNAKKTIAIIIMNYTKDSCFTFNCNIDEAKEKIDPIYNHSVFNEEGEAIDDEGKLKQYALEKDDESYYIGIENLTTKKLKLKLILDGLKINDGPFKGETKPVFEINSKERKVFEALICSDDDIFFNFDFA